MTTYNRNAFHSPLDRAGAEALVEMIDTLVEAELPADIDAPEEVDDKRGVVDVYHELSIDVEAGRPPTAQAARERAAAAGHDASTLVFEPAALERLASCRSTITIEYPSSLFDEPFFIAVVKGILQGVGAAVVETGDSSRYETTETYAAGEAKIHGDLWTKTAALAPKKVAPKKPQKIRPAKGGELEALSVQKRLERLIQDPIARRPLKKALEESTDAVRTYAAALMEEGPQPDVTMAKVLDKKVEEVGAARLALAEILRRVAED
jgi:hypothetical protein